MKVRMSGFSIHLIGISEEGGRVDGGEALIREIMAENF